MQILHNKTFYLRFVWGFFLKLADLERYTKLFEFYEIHFSLNLIYFSSDVNWIIA